MHVLLDNIEVNKDILIVNDGLNYGRFFDRATKECEIKLTSAELIELLESEYNKVRDEIKTDDQLENDASEFTKTNYCSLPELLSHSSDFEAILKTYLHIMLFKKLFPVSKRKEFVINSTDSITIKDDIITIKGKVFKLS